MALRCETCGADNPATNRFCGQCGKRLERTASDTPEEFWRGGGEHPFQPNEASADLPSEVIDFDNQIPLIAGNGTDRRLHPPPGLVEQVHDSLEREAELHDQLHHGTENHFETRVKREAEREESQPVIRSDYLRWDTSDDTSDDTSHDTSGDTGHDTSHDTSEDTIENTSDAPQGAALDAANGNAKEARGKQNDHAHADASAKSSAAQPIAHTFLAEGQRTSGTGVSGPSFLGLTDDREPEYDDEQPEPDSHLRRNLALAILAAALILAVVQWRSIRDYGLAYVQNGSMQVTHPVKGAPQNPPAIAADHSSHDLALPFATAKTGTPLAVEISPNADRALPVQQPSSSVAPKPPDSSASPDTPDTKQPPTTSKPIAENPVADQPTTKPPATVSHSTAKPRPSPARAAPNLARVAPISGVDEMKRAAAASDAGVRAAWLWKALGKGNPQAPIELAKMYEQGRGVVRSCDQAQVLLRSAAAKGNPQAKLDLQQIRARGGCSGR